MGPARGSAWWSAHGLHVQVCVGVLLVVCLLSVLRRQSGKDAGIQLNNADARESLVDPATRDA